MLVCFEMFVSSGVWEKTESEGLLINYGLFYMSLSIYLRLFWRVCTFWDKKESEGLFDK